MSDHSHIPTGFFSGEKAALKKFVVEQYNYTIPQRHQTPAGVFYFEPRQITENDVTLTTITQYQQAILNKFKSITTEHDNELNRLKTEHHNELNRLKKDNKDRGSAWADWMVIAKELIDKWAKRYDIKPPNLLEPKVTVPEKDLPQPLPQPLYPGPPDVTYDGKRITNPFIV